MPAPFTAHKLRLYLKQFNLRVSGGKATLVARVLRYIHDAQQILEREDNDATSDSELQSSDSEDPDDSRRYTIQTQMSNALQCKASRIQVYFLVYFSVGGG